MKKTVIRKLEFSRADVEEAIIAWLVQRDQPYPHENMQIDFDLGDEGATLSWTEEHQSH